MSQTATDIRNLISQLLLQQRNLNPDFVFPSGVTAFKTAFGRQMRESGIKDNQYAATDYNAVINNLVARGLPVNPVNITLGQPQQGGQLQQEPVRPRRDRGRQNMQESLDSQVFEQPESSGFNSQNMSMQSSSVSQNSQGLNLGKTGGNSLENFWANFTDYDEGTKPVTKVNLSGITGGNVANIKSPIVRVYGNEVLGKSVIDRNPKWVNDERTNPDSVEWKKVPGAEYKDGKWRSKFFKAPQDPVKAQAAQDKKEALLSTYMGTKTGAGSLVLPLLNTLQNALVANGFQPMGNISAKGVPLYLGRYYDPITKKLRVFGKPKVAINPTDWDQVYNKKVLMLAANWNQFVRGAEDLTSHIRNKPDWESIVAKKTEWSTPANRRYKQFVRAMKGIYNGTFVPYLAATADQKTAMKAAVQAWNYADLANLIVAVAKAKLAEENLSPGDQMRWNAYTTWAENPVVAYGAFKLMSEIRNPSDASYGDFAEATRKASGFKGMVEDMSMRGPNIKVSRKGIKKQAKISAGELVRLAKVAASKRPGELIDVRLNKKLKSEQPLPKFTDDDFKKLNDESAFTQFMSEGSFNANQPGNSMEDSLFSNIGSIGNQGMEMEEVM